MAEHDLIKDKIINKYKHKNMYTVAFCEKFLKLQKYKANMRWNY